MKKIFTLIAATVVAVGAIANDYTGSLSVLINGFGNPQEETIEISKQDNQSDEGFNLYTLSIKNFTLAVEGFSMPVGNIVVEDLPADSFNGKNLVLSNKKVFITAGDKEGVEYWLGPDQLKEGVNISLVGKFDETTALVDIVIDLRTELGQLIYVNFDNNAAPGPQPEPGKKGDLNGDGSVNAGDVSALYELILNPEQ